MSPKKTRQISQRIGRQTDQKRGWQVFHAPLMIHAGLHFLFRSVSLLPLLIAIAVSMLPRATQPKLNVTFMRANEDTSEQTSVPWHSCCSVWWMICLWVVWSDLWMIALPCMALPIMTEVWMSRMTGGQKWKIYCWQLRAASAHHRIIVKSSKWNRRRTVVCIILPLHWSVIGYALPWAVLSFCFAFKQSAVHHTIRDIFNEWWNLFFIRRSWWA